MQFSSYLALQAPRRCTCFWRQPTTMTDTVTCAVHGTTTTNTSTDSTSMSTFPLAPQWQQRRVLPSLDDIVRVVAPSSSSSPSPAGEYDHIHTSPNNCVLLADSISALLPILRYAHVCIYVCMYVFMYIYLNPCKYTYNACMYVYMYVFLYYNYASNNNYLAQT